METIDIEKINEYTKNAKLYMILFKISLGHIDYKNNRQETNLKKLYQKLQLAKTYESKQAIRSKIITALTKIGSNKTYITSSSIREEIVNTLKGQDIQLDYVGYAKNASKISEDPKEAALFYSREHVEAFRMIKYLEHKDEEKKEVVEEQVPDNKPIVPLTLLQEEAIKSIDQLIKDSKNKLYQVYGLTVEQEKSLKEAFPSSTSYRDVKIIGEAVEMNQLLAKTTTTSIEDLLTMSIDCHNCLVFTLLHSDGFGRNRKIKKSSLKLIGTLNMGLSLELYKKYYDSFMKYYRGLSHEEKKAIQEKIKSNHRYTNAFNISTSSPKIINPNELKQAVNRTIADDIKRWSIIDSDTKIVYQRRIVSATKLMTIEEIINLYKIISCEIKAYHNYNDEEQKQEHEYQKKTLTLLQQCFIEIIRTRLQYPNKLGETKKEEEQNAELRKIEIQNVGICNDYFNEAPLFTLHYIGYKNLPEVKLKSKMPKDISSSEKRYFGMDKVNQTIIRASGAYAKLKRVNNARVAMR